MHEKYDIVVTHGRSEAHLQTSGTVGVVEVLCEAIGAAAATVHDVQVSMDKDNIIRLDVQFSLGEGKTMTAGFLTGAITIVAVD